MEFEGAAGPAGIAADAGDVPWDQGDARGAVVSAEYESCRGGKSMPKMSGGVRISDFEWELDARGGADTVAEKTAQRVYGGGAIYVLEVD